MKHLRLPRTRARKHMSPHGDGQMVTDGTEAAAAHCFRGVPYHQPLPGTRTTVLEYLTAHAAVRPGAPFLTCVDGASGSGGKATTLTYGQLQMLTWGVASWIGAHLDQPLGATVGLLPTNDEPSVLALLGLLLAGCRVLVLCPDDPPARIAEQVGALGVVTVIRGPGVLPDRWPGAIEALPREQIPSARLQPLARPGPLADALILSTSGSTASSKMVVQSHRNCAVNAVAARRHHRLRPADRFLGCLPIHHVNGLHFTLLTTLAAGANAILATGFDPLYYPRLVERFRPRIASVVPSILEALTVTWRPPHIPSGFQYFASAAAPLSPKTARAVRSRLGSRVVQGYGLTETTNFSTIMPLDLGEADYLRLMEYGDVPPVGGEIFGNEVTVRDEAGHRVPRGTIGEVCARGHSVMSRYSGNEQATGEAFRGGWFHTGDLGFEVSIPSSGQNVIVLTGRSKNIAKVRGETVSLEEVERAIGRWPGVADAACVRTPHAVDGEQIIAAVVAAAGKMDVPALRLSLRAVLPSFAVPQRIVAVDAIPRTSTGKIVRSRLAEELRRAE
jgi:acyl-CoA synthetase (AMP-forming)/AMP-acid ligase II